MTETLTDLTSFQRDVLLAVARSGNPNGLAVKAELESHGYNEINHGRLYPNLDELRDKGLLHKTARNKRSNEYRVTARGRRELDEYAEWVTSGIERELTNGNAGLDEIFRHGEGS